MTKLTNVLVVIGFAVMPCLADEPLTLKGLIMVTNASSSENNGNENGNNGNGKGNGNGNNGNGNGNGGPAGTNVPEPATSALMGGGLLGISYAVRRLRKKSQS